MLHSSPKIRSIIVGNTLQWIPWNISFVKCETWALTRLFSTKWVYTPIKQHFTVYLENASKSVYIYKVSGKICTSRFNFTCAVFKGQILLAAVVPKKCRYFSAFFLLLYCVFLYDHVLHRFLQFCKLFLECGLFSNCFTLWNLQKFTQIKLKYINVADSFWEKG